MCAFILLQGVNAASNFRSPEWKLLSQVERDEIDLVFKDDGESWSALSYFVVLS